MTQGRSDRNKMQYCTLEAVVDVTVVLSASLKVPSVG